MKLRDSRGITLIALVVTIIVLIILASISIGTLMGQNGTIKQTNFAKYGATIREYQKALDSYLVEKDMNSDSQEETIIYTTDKDEIKEIIPIISDEDLEKFVIQDNEIRYREDKVTDEEERGWLAELGILAMVAVYALTYMNGDKVHKVVYADQVAYPLTNPTSSEGTFSGWYYEGTETEAQEGDSISSDITLYAKYEAGPTVYTATFMGANGVFAEIEGNNLTFPDSEPTKDTVKFTGWYYDEACTKVATVGDILTQDTTLYPRWNSYITNKLNGTYLFMYDYRITDSTDWYYVNNEEEFKALPYYDKISGTDTGMNRYPAWYRLGHFSNGDKLYSYQGSNKIISTKVLSWTSLDGNTTYPYYNISVDASGNVFYQGNLSGSIYTAWAKIEVTFEDGTTDTDEFHVYIHNACFVEGTEIILANRTTKKIEEITYEDELLVWDFDNGKFATAKPLFISNAKVAEAYNYIKFEDGTELKTVIDHRIFNVDTQKFTYTMDEEGTPIGTRVFKEDGTTTRLIERKVVMEEVNYYNIITDYHMNVFANGLLTSLRLNNLYKIENMKFVKGDRKLTPREEFANIPDKYFYGLRLAEQPKEINHGNDVKHTQTLEEYVKRLQFLEK